jgi:hypothetical protein
LNAANVTAPASPPFDDELHDDLVTYLAQRLNVPPDVALATLGEWLVAFEPKHASDPRAK